MFRLATIALASVLAVTTLVCAAEKLPPQPQGAEVAFVNGIQKDLTARFPTAQDAIKAGYFRYTNEDSTGAISYANLQWTSADPQHPSQLWYDATGNLLGADFSVPLTPARPNLWGVNPQRWEAIHQHIHYVVADASGKELYGGARAAAFTAAGGDPANPSADVLVKMGRVKDAASVKHIFSFPAIWDLIVWVKPNPSGAFAEANPTVKPTVTASPMPH